MYVVEYWRRHQHDQLKIEASTDWFALSHLVTPERVVQSRAARYVSIRIFLFVNNKPSSVLFSQPAHISEILKTLKDEKNSAFNGAESAMQWTSFRPAAWSLRWSPLIERNSRGGATRRLKDIFDPRAGTEKVRWKATSQWGQRTLELDSAAGIGHVYFCVSASLRNLLESQIRSIVHFDVSRACLLTLRSWIKLTSITLRLRVFSPVKAAHFPSTEKEPYICRGD